jgi:hypothetical protein
MNDAQVTEAAGKSGRSRRHAVAGIAGVALVAGIAGSAAFAAGASATTNSNSVSRAAPPSGQRPAVSGNVQAIDAAANTFTVTTGSGTTYTIDVSSSTTYADPSVTSPSLTDVVVGDRVAVFGTASSSTITATNVLIGGPAPTVAGTVKSVDSTDDSFTIESRSGTTYTVDVSGSTTYSDPSVTSPTLTNVTVGENVGVLGTESSTTVNASKVLIGGPGGGCVGMGSSGGPPNGPQGAPLAGGKLPSGTPPQG